MHNFVQAGYTNFVKKLPFGVKVISGLASLLACFVAQASIVNPADISSLNTGAGLYSQNNGAVLADPNWTVSLLHSSGTPPGGIPTGAAYLVPNNLGWPLQAGLTLPSIWWLQNDPTSSWLTYASPTPVGGDTTGGLYQYQMTFTAGKSGEITVRWLSDNYSWLFLNGQFVGSKSENALAPYGPYNAWNSPINFILTAGTTYTFDLDVYNIQQSFFNPTGARVEFTDPPLVPETSTMLAAALLLLPLMAGGMRVFLGDHGKDIGTFSTFKPPLDGSKRAISFLLLNQTFYPDVVSSGQHLAELASSLAARGHDVTVITSCRAYDDPGKVFPRRESWRGVQIHRVPSTHFGKGAKWRRIADFASFIVSCSLRLLVAPRHDVVIALTSPPLISFIGACLTRIKGGRFCYWVMDFNPDEAIAAGWLKAGSLPARVLDRMSQFSLRRADSIIALDRFMRDRIVAKGVIADKITVIPPWSHDTEVCFNLDGRARFRETHGLEGKFVVMYSGNHSPCHPLDTVLEAARGLSGNSEIVFAFVGGGSQFPGVRQFALDHGLTNIISLPYQPLSQLSASLSAADLHLVVMGNPFVGLVHPCKIYNILRLGLPFLYIGPSLSHITEIMRDCDDLICGQAAHGDVQGVINNILRAKEAAPRFLSELAPARARRFSEEALLPCFTRLVESVGQAKPAGLTVEGLALEEQMNRRLPANG